MCLAIKEHKVEGSCVLVDVPRLGGPFDEGGSKVLGGDIISFLGGLPPLVNSLWWGPRRDGWSCKQQDIDYRLGIPHDMLPNLPWPQWQCNIIITIILLLLLLDLEDLPLVAMLSLGLDLLQDHGRLGGTWANLKAHMEGVGRVNHPIFHHACMQAHESP